MKGIEKSRWTARYVALDIHKEYVLTRRQPYRGFTQERIAYKYLTWGWQMDEQARDNLRAIT